MVTTETDIVVGWNVLPRRQETAFLKLTIIGEECGHGQEAGKVEYVDVVLH